MSLPEGWEGFMKRLTLFVTVALLATLAPMGSASARGDGWTFLEASNFTVQACGTRIRETVVANKEYAKFALDPAGVLHFVLVTGVFKVGVTNLATGESRVVNASGTGHDAILYPNGDFLFTSSGPSLINLTPEQADETGLPQLFLNAGNMDLLFKADGSAELQSRTGHLTDLCAALS
jgi:hypothetical protein